MTRAEILDCLTDRPCEVCKFHESGRCERWDCVFEEKPEECEDAISRQAALDELKELDDQDLYLPFHFKLILDELPSVTPKQKTGHWKRTYDHVVNDWFYECNSCKCGFHGDYPYCPNCGAKMGESGVGE